MKKIKNKARKTQDSSYKYYDVQNFIIGNIFIIHFIGFKSVNFSCVTTSSCCNEWMNK